MKIIPHFSQNCPFDLGLFCGSEATDPRNKSLSGNLWGTEKAGCMPSNQGFYARDFGNVAKIGAEREKGEKGEREKERKREREREKGRERERERGLAI